MSPDAERDAVNQAEEIRLLVSLGYGLLSVLVVYGFMEVIDWWRSK